ncbi:MAG: hypothetical protein QM757_19955 [Paludibaculum sp.]
MRPTIVLAQLRLHFAHPVDFAKAAHFGEEQLGILDVPRINAETTQADCTEVFVANRDRLGGTPALGDLLPGRKVEDVALERGRKHFVPVLEVGQQRQGSSVERVQPGAEDVGAAAFVDEHRRLRLTHRKLRTILDFHVLHGIPVRKDTIFLVRPLDYVNELFLEKGFDLITKGHL